MRGILAVTAICGTLAPALAAGQQLRVEREKVLAAVGEVQETNTELVPVQSGPGRVLRQAFSRPATSTLRLHVTIAEQPTDASWHMEIVPATGARQRYRPQQGETEFWTRDLPGNAVTIELFTTAANVPLKLVIDRVVVSKAAVKPKSIVGPDQREPYRVQAEPIRTLGRSVVRLRFVDDERKRVFTCTGFLAFTSSHVLTNEHCINSDREMRSALADFDFDGGGAASRSVTFSKLLLADEGLDFSLLELSEPADRAALTVRATGDADGRPLVIVQHPGGETKQVSIRDCRVKGPQRPGVVAADSDFGHTCDTLGGSSGSPVFDPDTFTVVGLHHFGFFDGDPNPVNQAVRIPLVLEAIRKKLPALIGPPTN